MNQIAFSCPSPEVPGIEFIRLSKKPSDSEIPEDNYLIFNEEDDTYTQKNLITSSEEKMKNNSAQLKGENGVNYYYYLDIDFEYTYFRYFNLNDNDVITINTNANYFAHVVSFFSFDNPEAYSYVSSSSSGATLNIQIKHSGYYILKFRSLNAGAKGSVNYSYKINSNSTRYVSNCPVRFTGYEHLHSSTQPYNYFTSYLTGESHIWMEDNSGTPGRVRAHNNRYSGTGNYNWGANSRVKKKFSVQIKMVEVSSHLGYIPTGKCDLYIKCGNSTAYSMPYFPHLTEDDAIQSSYPDDFYNCASWAGGCTNLGRYFWASDEPESNNLSRPWYVEGDFWQSWDNYFGNNPPRYGDTVDYTRTGANSYNGEIAMWYNAYVNGGYGEYTHFSVTKPANNQPHGYDWESKIGGYARTFHPKDDLRNNDPGGYGEIFLYYRRVNPKSKSYSMEESIKLGLTVLQDVKLTDEEKNRIVQLKKEIAAIDINTFNFKLKNLINISRSPVMSIQSNPGLLLKTDEFKDLLGYCSEKGEKVWPMLFENIFDNENIEERDLSVIILNETTPQYGYLMKEVKQEWSNNNYTKEGAYIAPSPIENTKNYVKKLLALLSGESNKNGNLSKEINNRDIFSVYPSPVKVQTTIKFKVFNDNSNINLKVYDNEGKLREIILNNRFFNAGEHEISWSADNYTTGIYFINLSVNGKSFNRRILVE